MTKASVKIVFVVAIALVSALGHVETCAAADAKTNPYLTWTGPEYPWPNHALNAPSVKSEYVVDKEGSGSRVSHIVGEGFDIQVDGFGPFYIPDAGTTNTGRWKNSLVFKCRDDASAVLAFTHFAGESFFPKLSRESLMGYGKSLMETPASQEIASVTVNEEPAELPRKQMLASSRPMLLAWERKDSHGNIVRVTDIFFELNDGSILVASISAGSRSFAGTSAAAMDFLRHSILVSGESDKP